MKFMSCVLQIRSSSNARIGQYTNTILVNINWFIIHFKFINLPDLTSQYRHKDVLIQKQIKLCLYQHHERKFWTAILILLVGFIGVFSTYILITRNCGKQLKRNMNLYWIRHFFILLSEKNHMIQVQNQNCLVISFTSRENKQYV